MEQISLFLLLFLTSPNSCCQRMKLPGGFFCSPKCCLTTNQMRSPSNQTKSHHIILVQTQSNSLPLMALLLDYKFDSVRWFALPQVVQRKTFEKAIKYSTADSRPQYLNLQRALQHFDCIQNKLRAFLFF